MVACAHAFLLRLSKIAQPRRGVSEARHALAVAWAKLRGRTADIIWVFPERQPSAYPICGGKIATFCVHAASNPPEHISPVGTPRGVQGNRVDRRRLGFMLVTCKFLILSGKHHWS